MHNTKIALIGLGGFGEHILRNVIKVCRDQEIPLPAICDLDKPRIEYFSKNSMTKGYNDFQYLLKDFKPNVVFVATPPQTHFTITKKCLENGASVWCEKPLTLNSKECQELVDISQKNKLILHQDSTFCYSKEIQAFKQSLFFDFIGKPIYWESLRANFGPFLNDVDAIWDLFVHDLSILYYLFPEKNIKEIIAIKNYHKNQSKDNNAFVNVFYDDGFHANVHVSRSHPEKIRRLRLTGELRILEHSNTNGTFDLKIFNCSDKTMQKQSILSLTNEDLELEIIHFLECVKQKKQTLTNGQFAFKIIKDLENIKYT